ncbi:hypothetical protein [Priestia megaterium]|uniref:hypothetical protein n=1 Tax=Priestia megaterium TaxID=1404 RepID=UPI001C48080A|nr:hypothetical protein [Priestia megaterium]MBV6738295.1 hypothetical protein [Priestia megaterium]
MTQDIIDKLKEMNDNDLIGMYRVWLDELKARGMIRTNNVIGELGEYLAIKYYKENPILPKLQAAPTGTQNIDAISINGDRYSIKSTTGKVTGVFYGLNEPDSKIEEKQRFEYVILVLFNKDITLNSIYEITWENFLKHKRWHSRMRAWNLSVSKTFLEDCVKVF